MLNRLSDLLERRARLADRSLAIKVAAAPALMLALFALVAACSTASLLATRQGIERIVSEDMRTVTRLNATARQFEQAESSLYRLLVAKAATPQIDVARPAATIKTQLRAVRTELARFRNTTDRDQRTRVDRAIADVDKYAGAVDVVTSMLELDFASSATMLAPFRANAEDVERRINAIAAEGVAQANASAAKAIFMTRLFLLLLVVAIIVATVLGLFIAYVVGRATIGSIRQIAGATEAVMRDEKVLLAPLRRRDELGGVVAALEAFEAQREQTRQLEQTAAALHQEAKLEEERRAAAVDEVRRKSERERRETLAALAQAFEEKLAAMIHHAQEATEDLDRNAAALDETANSNRRLADELDGVAKLLAVEMEEASGATRTLATAFAEIDREVAGTSSAARSVNDHSRSAQEAVARSQDQAATIEEVVDMISRVARQTNLLALNATIEAARAGQAGSGFAVVASEIKSLAHRTASSSNEVRSQVEAVQQHIGTVVGSIASLGSLIASMDEGSSRVAAMSRGQAQSTAQLESRISQAYERSHTLAQASSSLGGSAESNIAAVRQLRRTSSALSETLQVLAGDAQAFTAQLRAG